MLFLAVFGKNVEDAFGPIRYQLFEANFGLFSSKANGGGTAFFAHVGGFVFGWLVATLLTRAGRVRPESVSGPLRVLAWPQLAAAVPGEGDPSPVLTTRRRMPRGPHL
jgi:membrane associated rhomboid family serine protease